MTTANYIRRILRHSYYPTVVSPHARNGWLLTTLTGSSSILWDTTGSEVINYATSFLSILRFVRQPYSRKVNIKSDQIFYVSGSVIYDWERNPIVVFEGNDTLYISNSAYTDTNLKRSLVKLSNEFLKACPKGNLCICKLILEQLGNDDNVDIEEMILYARDRITEQALNIVLV